VIHASNDTRTDATGTTPDQSDVVRDQRRWWRSPVTIGCFVLAAMLVATFGWHRNRLRLEDQAVKLLRASGVNVSMSNAQIFGFPVQEYPSAILLGRRDAARVDWSLLRQLRQLNQVQLEGTRHVDLALTELASVQTLRNVFLDESDVTAEGLRSFSKNPASMSLSLAGTTLSREGMEAIAQFSGIVRLNLSKAKFESAWLKVLHGHRSLRALDLRETDVEDDDIDLLAGFAGWELLILDGSRMTEQGISTLRERLPGVRVHWNGSE
jgi:hypothetical protein